MSRLMSTHRRLIVPMSTAWRLGSQSLAAPVALQQSRHAPMGFVRHYNESNSIEDLLSASQAWHSLIPERKLGDDTALRAAFNKLDLNGNGLIEAFELKQALLSGAMKDAAPELVDSRAEEMMKFADTIRPDGAIDFDEYKQIIAVGCTPEGRK